MPSTLSFGPPLGSRLASSELSSDIGSASTISAEQRAVLDVLPTAIGVVEGQQILWGNRAFTTLFGHSLEEIQGLSTSDVLTNGAQVPRRPGVAGFLPVEGGIWEDDALMRRKNGEVFWGHVVSRSLIPERLEAGIIWVVTDVSERRKTEDALRLSEARHEAAQEHALVGSWEIGSDFKARYWSKQMFALFQLDPNDRIPTIDEFLARVYPEDRATLPEALRQAVEQRKSNRVTYRGSNALGRLRYFETVIIPKFDEQQNLLAIIGTTQDITERKQTEDALRMSESRLETAQAQAKIGSWEFNPKTREMFFSKEMYRLLERDPMLGPPGVDEGYDITHPTERRRLRDVLDRAIESNQQISTEVVGSERVGEPSKYFETTMAAVRDKDGALLHIAGTFQDVTERRLAADSLRDSEQRLQRLLENSNDLIVTLDAGGRPGSLRGPLLTMLGYEREDLTGVNAISLVHPDDLPLLRQAIAEAKAQPGVPCRAEFRYRHKAGHWIDVEAVGTNWLKEPIIRSIVINLRQITERKQSERERNLLQEQLQQATKMEAVGRLAGGVAHDFNNLLTVITGNVELALGELNPHDPLAQYLTEVGGAAASASSLTRQLLAFSRRQIVEPKVVNLNDLILDLQKMLSRLIGEDIALKLRLSSDLGAVRLDPGQFDQVIVNLVVNARDAMPHGGILTLETTNVELDDGYCRTHREIEPGRFVALSVTDSGEGMTAEVMSHIFEPFFTTKPQGSGTGLGLSVTFGVVKQAGGSIESYSEPGHGTTFKIYLPRVDAPIEKLAKSGFAVEMLRGTETVLLVEDNDGVRELTTTMLRRLGYHPIVAANGKAALSLVRAERPRIDLLITDLVMPEMSGRELSERIREIYPNIAILYCSGYTEDTFIRHGFASENLQFIGKPFTLQQFGLKVRQVLEGQRPSLEP